VKMSRSRAAQAGAAITAGVMAVPLALLAGHGAAAATLVLRPAAPSATVAAHATRLPVIHPIAGPRLSISVSDGRASAKIGDRLSYVVSIRNIGMSAAPHLTITLTLPPGVPLSSVSRHGASAGEKVTWHASVRAGRTQTFRATGRVTRPPAQLVRLAAVACAVAKGGRNPSVCAADLDRSPAGAAAAAVRSGRGAASAGDPAGVYATVGGAAVAVVGVIALVLVTGRRTRLRRGTRRPGEGHQGGRGRPARP
jgi:uncharacterized repeat protein (TIGR01451 family)